MAKLMEIIVGNGKRLKKKKNLGTFTYMFFV